MTEEVQHEELVLDLAHVAALSLATWIYLIAKDEEAKYIIGNLADKLKNEMDGTGSEEEGTSGGEEHAEDSQG
jgi:hypothetical protein